MSQGNPFSLKILVVDDNEDVLQAIAEMVEGEGHEALRAADARDALEVLDTHDDIALLLTDIVLPGAMNGFDLAETAKRRRPGLHVIYNSGYLKSERVWEGTFLRKPWTKDDLKSAIAEVYRRGERS